MGGISVTIYAGDLARGHVIAALTAARSRGLWVHGEGPVGVAAGLAGDWSADDPRAGVSLVGAVLLHLQPEPAGGEEPLDAAARALGASLAWAEGLEAAWCREPMGAAALARTDARLYRDGYALGEELRRVIDAAARKAPANL